MKRMTVKDIKKKPTQVLIRRHNELMAVPYHGLSANLKKELTRILKELEKRYKHRYGNKQI